MATVSHLGTIQGICNTFPNVETLKWRRRLQQTQDWIDLGTAPMSAYLKLTLDQLIFIRWRVQGWSIQWTINSGSSSGSIGDTSWNLSYAEKTFTFGLFDQSTDSEHKISCLPFTGTGGRQIGSPPMFSISGRRRKTDPDSGEVLYDLPFPNFDGEHGMNIGNSFFSDGFFYEFDSGKIGEFYYWPYILFWNTAITGTAVSNGFTFWSELVDGEINTGASPPIRGALQTLSNGFLSGYKLNIELLGQDNLIEMDLYDSTEPSPVSGTKFNLNFGGITIKPTGYWPYDPGDGGGPIYNSATGEKIRSFP